MCSNNCKTSSGSSVKNRDGEDITIPVPWGSILAKVFGKAEDIPVLCIHGRSDNLESFSHLIPLLPSNYFYVCIDLPGHGKSSHADKGYLLDVLWYSMCVRRTIDYFKWHQLYLMGHSLGGYISVVITALYPDLVCKLVLLDTILYDHVPPSSTGSALRHFLFEPTLALEGRLGSDNVPTYSLSEILQKMKESRRTEVECSKIRSMVERNLEKVGLDKYKCCYDQRLKVLGPIHFTLPQIEWFSSAIHCPTLVILGKNSHITLPHEKLELTPLKSNGNVVLHVLDGDHDLHIAHPQRVAQLLVPFLARTPSDLQNLESKL